MRCEEIHNHLSAYLEGEAEPADRLATEGHLERCAGCRKELELLRRTIATLQSLEEVEAPTRLTAEIQTAISARESSAWRRLVTRLFLPFHIKLPLEAMALVLITIGAVYLYRSAPELAQAPEPLAPAVTEKAAQGTPPSPAGRRDQDERAGFRRSAEKTRARPKTKKEREALAEKEIASRALRMKAPAGAKAVSPLRELILKTQDPSQAASRITEITTTMGGRLLEMREEHQLILTIPAQAYPKFLAALREMGALMNPPAEAPSPSPSQETLILSLRLVP